MRVPPLDPAAPRSPWQRAIIRFARTRAGRWFGINVSARIDPFLLRISGGRISSFPSERMVNLTVPGRKSGDPRTSTLLYFTQGDDVIIIASSFGRPDHPQWYRNVVAHPEVTLSAAGQTGRYLARETEGEERERLFAIANQLYPGYDDYAERVGDGRVIPVMRLSPLE